MRSAQDVQRRDRGWPGRIQPAARLGRVTRTAKTPDTKGVALTPAEARQFLEAASDVCPEYYPLFLAAVRAGLRRGELVALQWGDIQFGAGEKDPNRFITVRHNYVRREHTSTKSRKLRRVDLSKELRAVLLQLRDQRLLNAYQAGKDDSLSELVFRRRMAQYLIPTTCTTASAAPWLTACFTTNSRPAPHSPAKSKPPTIRPMPPSRT